MEPEVIDMLPDKGDHEDTTFPELALSGRLGGYKIEGYWRGIDTVKDLKEANAEYITDEE
jgi:NDP-sugar pyrophosphorylase family protein